MGFAKYQIVVLLAVSLHADEKKLTREDAAKLKNPVPYSKESIARGRSLFARDCVSCHGPDGKAQVDVVADATDLTTPAGWKNGTADGQIFRSIRDGAGSSMPAFQEQIHPEDEIWRLVNFIRSLWPESSRPRPQEDSKSK